MKLVKVPSSQGSLEKNLGCELAPEILCGKKAESVNVIPNDLESTDENIYSKAKEIINEKPVFVGGDHSITYSLFKAFSENFSNASLIIFDAHADCTSFFKPVSHEDMNKVLIEEGLLEKERLLIIGIRKIWAEEKPFLEKNKIQLISAQEIHNDLEKTKIQLQEFVSKQKNIYLSFDIDALDPSIAPGTGYLEENGLTEKETFELLQTVLDSKKVKATDLVEINPKLDEDGKTIIIGKRILKKLVEQ
ncbi:MAG: arginase family protein [archaeon]|nr:arginase family protein [archaeon]